MSASLLKTLEDACQKALAHLEEEYKRLQIGRASSGLVEDLQVESYGMKQPLKAVAGITIPDAKTVQIQPWDRSLLAKIEKAIQESDLNLNPVNNGAAIILNIPPLTEERRRDLVKVVNRLEEDTRITVRNARHDTLSAAKRMQHDGDLTEDEQNRLEKQIQERVDKTNDKISELARGKENAVMTL